MQISDSRLKSSSSFGQPIPDEILDDLCFRFLINIPDDQVNHALLVSTILTSVKQTKSILSFITMYVCVFYLFSSIFIHLNFFF